MGARRGEIAGVLPADARAVRGDVEPERIEHEHEKPVVLETVTAALRGDQFVLDRFGCERNRASEEHVEVFKRNGHRVMGRNFVKGGKSRFAKAGVSDTVEICVEVEGGVDRHGG